MEFIIENFTKIFPELDLKEIINGIPSFENNKVLFENKKNPLKKVTIKPKIKSKNNTTVKVNIPLKFCFYFDTDDKDKLYCIHDVKHPEYNASISKLLEYIFYCINSLEYSDIETDKVFKKNQLKEIKNFCSIKNIDEKLKIAHKIIANSTFSISSSNEEGERQKVQTENNLITDEDPISITTKVEVGKIMSYSGNKKFPINYFKNPYLISNKKLLKQAINSINYDKHLNRYLTIDLSQGLELYTFKLNDNDKIFIGLPIFGTSLSLTRNEQQMKFYLEGSMSENSSGNNVDSLDDLDLDEGSGNILVEEVFGKDYINKILSLIKDKNSESIKLLNDFLKFVNNKKITNDLEEIDLSEDESDSETELN